jgi:hypothetical protein
MYGLFPLGHNKQATNKLRFARGGNSPYMRPPCRQTRAVRDSCIWLLSWRSVLHMSGEMKKRASEAVRETEC